MMFVVTYFAFFLHNHFAVRLLLLKKKYFYFVLTSACLIFFSVFSSQFLSPNMGTNPPFLVKLQSGFFTFFVGTAVYFLNNWILENVVKTKLQLIRKESELDFLKQQISPHFLFNAINNLYGTALAAPDLVADKILELSDLLRYQVQSTTKDHVRIEDEITFVNNYLSYTNYKSHHLQIQNDTIGTVESFWVPPLLFLPMLENAVKYSSETEQPFIHILWTFTPESLTFNIKNSYLANGSSIKGTKVGLENLKKRLELLKLKHSLNIDLNDNQTYQIELKLWQLSINA
jgi:LytS/YehU family sensor histidine kinase